MNSLFTNLQWIQAAECTIPVTFTANEDGITYRVDTSGAVNSITTTEDVTFKFEGLDADTYYLKETNAPAGYNELQSVITVKIDEEGKIYTVVNESATEDTDSLIEVENFAGVLLPTTGGMGTTMIYIVGLVLALGAVAILFVRKRKEA